MSHDAARRGRPLPALTGSHRHRPDPMEQHDTDDRPPRTSAPRASRLDPLVPRPRRPAQDPHRRRPSAPSAALVVGIIGLRHAEADRRPRPDDLYDVERRWASASSSDISGWRSPTCGSDVRNASSPQRGADAKSAETAPASSPPRRKLRQGLPSSDGVDDHRASGRASAELAGLSADCFAVDDEVVAAYATGPAARSPRRRAWWSSDELRDGHWSSTIERQRRALDGRRRARPTHAVAVEAQLPTRATGPIAIILLVLSALFLSRAARLDRRRVASLRRRRRVGERREALAER